jgi:hypothetical protein
MAAVPGAVDEAACPVAVLGGELVEVEARPAACQAVTGWAVAGRTTVSPVTASSQGMPREVSPARKATLLP